MAANHHHFNYIELPADDLSITKKFYGDVFGWTFIDYGESYAAIEGAGVDGGFDANSERKAISGNGALVVLYSENLSSSLESVKLAGGNISVEPFDFPGGRRFHFIDPSGNELAVWSAVTD